MRSLLVIAILCAVTVQILIPGFQAQAAPKVIRISMGGEPPTFDPQQANYTDQVAYSYAAWRSLLKYDVKGNVLPSIATDVPTQANGGISKDGLTYTFKLRDWKWSDGKGNVTAGDFVYSWERLVDPKQASAYGYFLNGIVLNAQEIQDGKKQPTELGVKAVDDKTLQVTLVKPAAYFVDLAATWALAVVRKDNVERAGLPSPDSWFDPANGEVVGSGPFVVTSWTHGSEIIMKKNPNYSGTPAKVDEIDFALQDDQAVSYQSYLAGDLDVSQVPVAELDAIKADASKKSQLVIYPIQCTYYFRMDNTKPPFDKQAVREAFAYAIDRNNWANVIWKGLRKPTTSFLPPGMLGYDTTAGNEFQFNPDKAKKALADAGYPNGQGFPTVPYNYRASADGQRQGEWFQAQLQQVLGVNLELQPMENAAIQSATSAPINKIAGTGTSGWCSDYPYPSDWIGLVFKSGGSAGNANNIPGFNDATYDKLSDAADADIDPAKADAAYNAAQKELIAQVPGVFLGYTQFAFMQSPKVTIQPAASDGGFPGAIGWEDVDIK